MDEASSDESCTNRDLGTPLDRHLFIEFNVVQCPGPCVFSR